MKTATKIDSIYTPSAVAHFMVDSAGVMLGAKDLVADFAAGSGELLIAAHERWPLAQIVATDISRDETKLLKRKGGNWEIGTCDFLDPKSRNHSQVLRRVLGKTSLVIINPPFSCRGGTRISASASGTWVKCSIGMAFVVNSVDYLATGGTLVAILPSGCLTSERDVKARELLRKLGVIEIVKHNGHRTFPEATVETVVIRFLKGKKSEEPSEEINKNPDVDTDCTASIYLVRGNIQMNEIEFGKGNEGVILIHSTDLKEGEVSSGRKVINKRARLVAGPMVLLPRVGRAMKEKIVCYTEDETFALSDCVVAVMCHSKESAEKVWESLTKNWNLIEKSYTGSGAKYITINRIIGVLNRLGYVARFQGRKQKGSILSQYETDNKSPASSQNR